MLVTKAKDIKTTINDVVLKIEETLAIFENANSNVMDLYFYIVICFIFQVYLNIALAVLNIWAV